VNKKVDGQRKQQERKKKGWDVRVHIGQWAKREKKKGRVTGGIMTGIKLGIQEKRQGKGEEEGCMERKVDIAYGGK
jgi:hypothetical protein